MESEYRYKDAVRAIRGAVGPCTRAAFIGTDLFDASAIFTPKAIGDLR